MTRENLIAYGARCTWWDDIDQVAHLENGLPCCPNCHGVLFQQEEPGWWNNVERHERDGHPGYSERIRWARGKCFPGMKALEAAWVQDQLGNTVEPER